MNLAEGLRETSLVALSDALDAMPAASNARLEHHISVEVLGKEACTGELPGHQGLRGRDVREGREPGLGPGADDPCGVVVDPDALLCGQQRHAQDV